MSTSWKYIFGPVLSRRLGQSLGVDLIPSKLCTLNCVYCEIGRTDKRGLARKEYYPVEEILKEVREALESYPNLDHITISGSGEPTLHSGIGRLITGIKDLTSVPIAVLTNGTLLTLPEVRNDLLEADIVSPSLDAVTQEAFERVDRPHPHLQISQIIDGLRTFRREFKGQLWLEILFVKGLNDSADQLRRMKEVIDEVRPDRIQLNTVVRPPAESFAEPLSNVRLHEIAAFFGPRAQVIGVSKDVHREPGRSADAEQILGLLRRRPMTMEEMVIALEMHRSNLLEMLNDLIRLHHVQRVEFEGREFYQCPDVPLDQGG
jgi:wyosine [tRNA(Phe)-imidazoG37] synthetase (radical SAM superfamily)